MKVNLQKASEKIKISLAKVGINKIPTVAVGLCLDVSGSFEEEHINGRTNDLAERLIPYSITFDDDGNIDLFTFSDGESHAHYVGELNANNYINFVKKNIIGKVPGYGCGTDYSYVLEAILRYFHWILDTTPPKNPCLVVPASAPRKALIFFITDGANSDRNRTSKLLKEMQDKKYQVYIQFFGVGPVTNFEFLQDVADKYSNTGLYVIKDLNKFVQSSDEEINQIIIQQELIDWLKK